MISERYEISVIVPCYNGERYLSRCLDSLLAQTMPVEIVVVNDGSTDGSARVLAEYAERYPNIRIVTKQNEGLPQARRSGLEAASGAYIGCVDCDDWVEPQMYAQLYKTLRQSNADVACASVFIDFESGKNYKQRQTDGGRTLTSQEALRQLHCRRAIFSYMWNKLFRREMFDGIEFPKGNFIGEDYETIVQILENARRIDIVDIPMYHYWQSVSSMSRGEFKPAHKLAFSHYKRVSEALIARNPAIAGAIRSYIMVEYMSFVVAMYRSGRYETDMLSQIKVYVRSHLGNILGQRQVLPVYKGCALLMSINYRLMIAVYRLLYRK